MSYRKFTLFAILILVFAFVVRIVPLFKNNFYFTMDQGNDAIHAREILVRHKLPLLGPETSIFGLYAGPAWYYFLALGYHLADGHPAGPVVLLILLNVFLTFLIMKKISVEVSPRMGLLIGALLQTSWWFYDASRYAFNPFPNTFLVFLAIFYLADFLKGEKNKYFWAVIPIGLFFHTDMASAIAVNLFFFGFGLFAIITRRLKWQEFLIANLLIILFLGPHIVSEYLSKFSL